MSLFGTCQPTGVFSPCPDDGTMVSLAFTRPARSINSAGETILSFLSTLTITMDLQPQTGEVKRYVHGVIDEVNFLGILIGSADIKVRDRTVVDGELIEVANVRRYGSETLEIDLKYVGR